MFCSLLTEADAGHTEFTDEIFQNETRFPGGDWKPAAEPYTDVVNAQHMHESTHVQSCTSFQELSTQNLSNHFLWTNLEWFPGLLWSVCGRFLLPYFSYGKMFLHFISVPVLI